MKTIKLGGFDISLKSHAFVSWTGAPVGNSYGGKTVLEHLGQPLFAELVALEIFKENGYNGVWVDTYSKKFRVGLPESTNPVQLPVEIDQKLQEIIRVNKSAKGVWDLLLWKADEIKFVELKRKGKDAIRTTQIDFFSSAIKCGLNPEHFEIIEWDVQYQGE